MKQISFCGSIEVPPQKGVSHELQSRGECSHLTMNQSRRLPERKASQSRPLETGGIKARADGVPGPGTDAQPDEWSTQDKFLVVVETASMNETELAEYARKKGLYVEQRRKEAQ